MNAGLQTLAGSGVAVIGDPGRAGLEVGPGTPPDDDWPSDFAISSCLFDSIEVRAASVRGIQHRHTNSPRQDAFSLRSIGGGSGLVAVVCDGVGSLASSHAAAEFVCGILPDRLLGSSNWKEAVEQTNAELIELDQSLSSTGARVMATTLVAASVVKTTESYALHLTWVGDSEAWLLDDAGAWTRLSPLPGRSDQAGLASAPTRALPTTSVPEINQLDLDLRSGRVFLMTDGVAKPLGMNTEVQDALASCWRMPPDPLTFASQVGFARRTFIDDRTVVGIWLPSWDPQPPDQEPPEETLPGGGSGASQPSS